MIAVQARRCSGLDLRGGVELVYEGRPTPQVPEVTPQAIDDAIETIRKRTDSLGVSEPEIQRAGADQISIGLPDVKNADRAIEQVGTTAKLQFYDWEPNVLGDRGPDAPFAGSKALFQAVELASKSEAQGRGAPTARRPPEADLDAQRRRDRKNDTAGDQLLPVRPRPAADHRPGHDLRRAAGGLRGRARPAARRRRRCRRTPSAATSWPRSRSARAGTTRQGDAAPQRARRPRAQVLKVPQGIVVIEAERAPNQPETVQQFFVLEDDSELSGADIKNPEQNIDQNTQEPIVTMEFTDKGREAFARRHQADRRARLGDHPAAGHGPRAAAFQRFAITLDNQIVSLRDDRLPREPRGHRRPHRRPDQRHRRPPGDPGPRREPAHRRAADRPEADLADPGLGDARPAGARPGPARRRGRPAADDDLPARLLPRARRGGGDHARDLRGLLFALVKLIPITLTLPGIAGMVLTLAWRPTRTSSSSSA